MNKNQSKKSFLAIDLVITILLIYTFLLIIGIELQMELIERVVIRDAQYKIIILITIILYFIIKKRIKLHKLDGLSIAYLITIVYLIVSTLFMTMYNASSLNFAINILGRGYAAIIISYFFYSVEEKYDIEKIFKIILFFCIINLVLTFIQRHSNSILFKYIYDDMGNYIFNSTNFGENNTRSVGMTSSGYNLGIILVFLFATSLVVSFSKVKKFLGINRILFIILIPITVIGIYYTQTRNIYFFAIYVLIYAFVYFKISILKKFIIILYPIFAPIIYFFSMHAIAYGKINLPDLVIYSGNTFLIRLYIFAENINYLKNTSLINLLLGNSNSNIDNILLYWINNIGVIGAILMLILFICLYVRLIKMKEKDVISIIITIYVSSVFFIGLFNLLPFEYYFFTFILGSIYLQSKCKKVELD